MSQAATSNKLDYPTIGRRMRDIAVRAGQETLKYYQNQHLQTEDKDDGSPVSEADLAANTIILEGLRESYPDIPIITEEDGSDEPDDLSQPFFLIDPLDGTKDFIRGSGHYTVNIALVIDHKPVLGAVYAPVIDLLQWTPSPRTAIEEAAPFTDNEIGSQIALSCRNADNNALVAVLSRSHFNAGTQDFLKNFEICDSSTAGSSLKFCMIARAEADIYPRLHPTSEWDTAAAHAILQAAGGRVLNAYTGEDLIYGKDNVENPHFIAIGANVQLPAHLIRE